MAGGRQHLDLVMAPLVFGRPSTSSKQALNARTMMCVGIVVVVAILGHSVQQPLAQRLVPREIGVQDPDELLPGSTAARRTRVA